eukprot:jgi/Hompol1/4922/HPOL_004026-RA
MIPLFTTHVVAVDTAERDRALQEASEARKEVARLLIENKQLQMKYEQTKIMRDVNKREAEEAHKELFELRKQIERDKWIASENVATEDLAKHSAIEHTTPLISPATIAEEQPIKFSLRHGIELKCLAGTARALRICERDQILFASMKDNRYTRHGILKVNLRDVALQEFVEVHKATIRDMDVCPNGDGTILSTSLDKTLKITSFRSNTVLQT